MDSFSHLGCQRPILGPKWPHGCREPRNVENINKFRAGRGRFGVFGKDDIYLDLFWAGFTDILCPSGLRTPTGTLGRIWAGRAPRGIEKG